MSDKLVYVQCDLISPNRFQPRKEFIHKDLEELAESIDAQGLIQPIIIRQVDDLEGFDYELIAGERRLRATRDILGKEKIRALLRENVSNEASQEESIAENLQRKDLNPIEEAIAIVKLMEVASLTQEQVAKRLGKSRSYVGNVIRLVRLHKDVVNLVSNGSIDRSKAIVLLGVTDQDAQYELAKKVVAKNWPIDKLRAEVEKVISSSATKKKNIVRKEVDGKSVVIATPSKGHRRKAKAKPQSCHFVLVELDTADTVRDFVKYMAEQDWKTWAGEAAVSQLETLKELLEAPVATTEEPA